MWLLHDLESSQAARIKDIVVSIVKNDATAPIGLTYLIALGFILPLHVVWDLLRPRVREYR